MNKIFEYRMYPSFHGPLSLYSSITILDKNKENIIYNNSIIDTIDINMIKNIINKYINKKLPNSNNDILDGYIASYYLKNNDKEVNFVLCNNYYKELNKELEDNNINLKNMKEYYKNL